MTFIPEFKDILFEAWNRTEPCKDGIYTDSPFCPTCLLEKIREVGDDLAWVTKQKERHDNRTR